MWNNAEYIKSQLNNPFEILNQLIEMIQKSKEVFVIISFFALEYFNKIISHVIDSDVHITFITTPEVIELTKETEISNEFVKLSKERKMDIYIYL